MPRWCWIDCPRGSFRHRAGQRRRRAVKDLASLDRDAAKFCSRAERLRFLMDYLGQERLDEDARQLIGEILTYSRWRWPPSTQAPCHRT